MVCSFLYFEMVFFCGMLGMESYCVKSLIGIAYCAVHSSIIIEEARAKISYFFLKCTLKKPKQKNKATIHSNQC